MSRSRSARAARSSASARSCRVSSRLTPRRCRPRIDTVTKSTTSTTATATTITTTPVATAAIGISKASLTSCSSRSSYLKSTPMRRGRTAGAALGPALGLSLADRTEQGRWSRGRDARTTAETGLRRLSLAGPSMAPPRLLQSRSRRGRFGGPPAAPPLAVSPLPLGDSERPATRRHALGWIATTTKSNRSGQTLVRIEFDLADPTLLDGIPAGVVCFHRRGLSPGGKEGRA
jgi:hypothetical protein